MDLAFKLDAQPKLNPLKFANYQLAYAIKKSWNWVDGYFLNFFWTNNMKQVQRGFTLIELVMVIVILGVLAAVALPKFVDLKGDAEAAAVLGMAGGLASANSINYAGCAVSNQTVTTNKCVKISKCSDVGTLLVPSLTIGTVASATSYYLLADTAVGTNGSTGTCELRKLTSGTATTFYSASFGVVGAAN